MKEPIAVFAAITLFATVDALGQSDRLIVKPRKVEYTRSGRNVPDYKKNFEVRYPEIQNKLPLVVRKNLAKELDYWRVFKMSFRNNLRDDNWLSSFDYEIKYNQNYIFDIWLTAEGVAAYPDSSTQYIVLDTKTGKRLTISDLFRSSSLLNLRNAIRRKMVSSEDSLEPEIKHSLNSQRENDIYRKFNPGPDTIELKDLSGFSVRTKGILFLYDYGFPHAAQAEEPSGEFLLTWAQLRHFIKPGSLLSRVAR